LTNHNNVILFPGVKTWRFYDFVNERDDNLIEDWKNGLSEASQNAFNDILKENKKTENQLNWLGFRGFLEGGCKKYRIWELGFKCENVQYRLLNIFEPGRTVVLLVGCYHKGRVYTPADALKLACKRAKSLEEGDGGRHERAIRMDR
jgi:hypothetical protein